MNENPTEKKKFTFLNPIEEINKSGPSNVRLFGIGEMDFKDIKKNYSKLGELATSVGMGYAKTTILKNTIKFFESKKADKREDIKFEGESLNNLPDAQDKSVFATPIFSNLLIKSGSWTDDNGGIVKFPDIRVDAVIFEIQQDNNIITTDIQGRNKTIIEFVSTKSALINCKGRILGSGLEFPYRSDLVQGGHAGAIDLNNALSSNKPLKIDSWYLSQFGIDYIVIKSKTISQEEGGMQSHVFEFDAIADYPLTLKISK